jgi:pyruvate dehydrogenase E2 component (dihydrolipoyllysine-residue acetyltransferase)
VPKVTEVNVPDLGDFADVPVIEIHVKAGDVVNEEDPLITLESDKATMDVPSPAAGRVGELRVKLGDLLSAGSPVLLLDTEGALTELPSLADQQEPPGQEAPEPVAMQEPARRSAETARLAPAPSAPASPAAALPADFGTAHAGPGVRRLARELGVDLTTVTGTGPKGRITKEDLLAIVRGPGAGPGVPRPAVPAAAGIPEIPAQDFSKFGPVEVRPLSRIQRISGQHLHRSWLNVPHVTHNDEADITELDALRRELDTAARAEGYRVTLLAFLMKVSVSGLREFPRFNSSLTPQNDALVYKGYYHIGVAVDTADGLVVPVIRDVDRKGVKELSRELSGVSARAREGKLGLDEMQGACFTITSLGGIGGTAFTPIVNAPEVAILGVVRSRTAPVWDGTAFVPRLLLPLSLSYDHRVIDGALAARFARYVCHLLEDIRRLVL